MIKKKSSKRIRAQVFDPIRLWQETHPTESKKLTGHYVAIDYKTNSLIASNTKINSLMKKVAAKNDYFIGKL